VFFPVDPERAPPVPGQPARPAIGSPTVEITIGLRDAARELTLTISQPTDQIAARVAAALDAGTVLTLTDDDGRVTLLNAAAIAYVQLGSDSRRFVGFSA